MVKEERPGYKWIESDDKGGGFWLKESKRGSRHSHRTPWICPNPDCIKGFTTSGIDESYLREYGVCRTCHSMFIEARVVPAIDVEYFRKKYQENQ